MEDLGDTSQKILGAAASILGSEGYSALSMRRIARAVGVSQAALYRHFASKAEILERLVGEGYGRLLSKLEVLAAEEARPSELIRGAIRIYVDFALASPDLFKAVMLRDAGPARAQVDSLGEGVSASRRSFGLLVEALRRGMAEGEFDAADPELTAQALWTALYGLAARLVLEPGTPPERREALIVRHAEILLGGLRSRGPGPEAGKEG